MKKSSENKLDESVRLLNAGQLKAAVLSIKEYLLVNRKSGFGWHILGVTYLKMGCYSESIDALKNALEYPGANKENVISDLGSALNNSGDYSGALELYRKGVDLFPNSYSILINIGNLLVSANETKQGLYFLDRADKVHQNSALVKCNIGLALAKTGRYKEAEIFFETSIRIERSDFYLFNLAKSKVKNRKYSEALELLSELRTRGIDNFEIKKVVGSCLSGMCLIEEAIDLFSSLCAEGCDNDVFVELGWLFQKKIDNNRAISFYKKADIQSADSYSWAVLLAGLLFICEDMKQANYVVSSINPDTRFVTKGLVSALAYKNFIEKLLRWHERHPQSNSKTKNLYVFGDSHSLSLSHVNVNIFGSNLRAITTWAPGAKAWHLASPEMNEIKYIFQKFVEALPRNSTIIMVLGEIDCRYDEGIRLAASKLGVPVDRIINATTKGYVGYINDALSDSAVQKVLVHGVPYPGYLSTISDSDFDESEFVDFILRFNRSLEQAALSNGFCYIDVFNPTRHSQKFHIDTHHITPGFYAQHLDVNVVCYDH